ncbi:MAG: hypothetical protein J2O46_04660 [Nocardioides sp.]|nr:hypothetical protein [Nocardioides sp.]
MGDLPETKLRETTLSDPEGILVEGGDEVGVLVLSGSSGRIEADRCRLLAAQGMTAASIRWFGSAGQADSVDRVPLETFDGILADLHARCRRLAVLGTSRGAEAALLLGSLHAELDAVVAFSPSDVVWAALGTERPQRTSWTLKGEPLPFVPYDDGWDFGETEGPRAYVDMYCHALELFADRVPAARIPVERIDAKVVVVAGEADELWPSALFAEGVRRRRAAARKQTVVVTHPRAGHRVVLPGEQPLPAAATRSYGGDDVSDAELGALAWPQVMAALRGVGGKRSRRM